MEIKTKYNIRDKVWLMQSNKALELPINSISINISEEAGANFEMIIKVNVIYCICINGCYLHFTEDELFPTKTMLINSL